MKSLRAKLVAAFATVTAATLTGLGILVYGLTGDALQGDIDMMLRDKAFQLSRTADVPSGLRGSYALESQMEAGNRQILAQYQTTNGEPRYTSARLVQPLPLTDGARAAVLHRSRWYVETIQRSNALPVRVATVAITKYIEETKQHVLIGYAQAAVTFKDVEVRLRELGFWLALGGLAALISSSAATWFIVGHWLRAADLVAGSAQKLGSEKSLQQRLYVPGDMPELARLAESINELLDRVTSTHTAQQRFLADASHELRTPLTVLRGELEVALRRERTSAEYQCALKICHEEINRLTKLVDQLLTLARSDEGRAMTRTGPVDLGVICREVVEQLRHSAAEKGLKLEVDANDTVEVTGDQNALERIVCNLVENAIRYSPPGEEVRVSAQIKNGEGVINVTDTGLGIPAEHLPRIFERFYRVDTSRSRNQGGAGLGLGIVKSLTEAHGGRVEVASEVGKGSTFRVSLARR